MAKLYRPTVDSVEAVILHIVDPPGTNRRPKGEARGLILSERTMPAGESAIFEYFLTHVQRAVAHAGVRAARFRPRIRRPSIEEEPNPVPGLCSAALDGSRSMVEASGELARRLYGIIEPMQRVSTGDLALCICRSAGGGRKAWSRFVALLKIDPAEGYLQVVREAERKSYVTIDVDDEIAVLPTTRQTLQKAAFIGLPGERRDGYDLLLLDLQTSGAGRDVTRFFAEYFLGAEVVTLGEVPETDVVVQTVIGIRNEARPHLDAEKLAGHEDRARRLFGKDRVSISDVGKLFTGEYRRRAEAALRERLPSEEIEFDSKRVKDLTRKVEFKGEGGLRVSAPSPVWPRVLKEAKLVTDDVGGPYWRIVIHTKEWEEIA